MATDTIAIIIAIAVAIGNIIFIGIINHEGNS